MNIFANGAWAEVRAADLQAVLQELGFEDACVATAVNGRFVPVAERAQCVLQAGDHIEVLAPMQGG